FNDASASASDALTSLLETVTVGDGSSLSEAVVEEGDVNNKVTATIEDGKVVSQTETKNSKLDAFNSIATLSAFQWRHEMNDLTKRMGELRDSEGTIGAWARVYGSELQYGDQNVKQKSNSIQVGSDIEVAPGFKVGAAFNYTNGSAEYNNGDADNNAYGLGIYGTWMAENGMFLDVIAKYVRLDTDFSLNGFDGSFDNNAYSLSAEFGWRFDLNDLAFVEPQVELSYGRVAGDTFTAANGVTVKQDDFDTLIGRAGVRAGFKFPENKGNIYAKFSVAHDFQGEMDAVATNGTALNTMHSDIGGTWVEYGVGGNFRLCKNAYGYVDLERTSGAEVNANYRWNIGLRTFF
ncbi:autotransporter outer membrane beta-barrel domain-containing protein, partial [Sutterella wadsworthensis]